ncbi:tetratricopeptide repeat protein [Sorangium sp. So ce394]|uniref:tetratricopeptide repeat protein n=1 Tax=Sorangium sp. So ce394 TaxID=3133310 RepID=UPI003F5B2B20
MTRALVTSSKYSPGNMMPQALEALFVGREKTLSDVLKRIAASATGSGKHYILLVGPRGVGKTHFVALLHHRLMTDPQYEAARKKLKIAYLNEEEWGVASFLDLLVRILNALASGGREKELDDRIERIYQTHEKDPTLALEVAQSLLLEAVGRDTLLLLCENLVDIFTGLGEEGQKRWRAFIQEHPFWTILATTPALFAGVQLQTSPFYGFFTERKLEKLDFEMAVQLLKRKAEVDGHHELANILGTPMGRARVRAIHHLAGGNHRVYVIMSEFLDRESIDDLIKPFMRMVDDLTPYYQDRMRPLAPQQRKLVEFLSRHEKPAMVKLIAQRCLISQQTAAKQLGELAKLGFVQSIRSGRSTYYEVAEPLMRICVEVKDNKTAYLRLFVRFLREWFTARELTLRLRDICSSGVPERHVDRLHIEMALKEYSALPHEPVLKALEEEGLRCAASGDYVGQAEAYARLSDEENREEYHTLCVSALCKLGKDEEATSRVEAAIAHYPQSCRLAAQHAELLFRAKRYEEALSEIERAMVIKPGYSPYLCFRGSILMALERYEDVIRNEDVALRLDPNHLHSFEQKAWAFLSLGRFVEAETAARMLLSHKRHAHAASAVTSRALFGQGKYEEALKIIRRALRLDPQCVADLCFQGTILSALRRYEDVVVNEERLLAIDPTHWHGLYVKGKALMNLGRFDDAERAALSLLERVPHDHDGVLLACLAKSGAHGFQVGAEYLAMSLASIGKAAGQFGGGDFEPVGVLAAMMLMEAAERGPLEMAKQIVEARLTLEKPGLDELLGDALMRLVNQFSGQANLRAEAWDEALPILTSALRDLPECELPLKMLGAAARYSRTLNVADLLDLPLEQRSLLLDTFAQQPRTYVSAEAVAKAAPRRKAPSTRSKRTKRLISSGNMT